jgi:mono/diheme cytochrome c family protein
MTERVRKRHGGIMRLFALVSMVVLVWFAAVASPPVDDASSAPIDEALVDAGRDLYLQHYCGACHALAAVGAAGVFGPPHDDMGRVAQARVDDPELADRWPDARAYLRESIVDPRAYLVPGWYSGRHAMPAYDLVDGELAALVEFLLAQVRDE